MKITMGHNQAALRIKQWIMQKRYLNPFKNPVLILAICISQYVINTSEKVVKITPSKREFVCYESSHLSTLNLYR